MKSLIKDLKKELDKTFEKSKTEFLKIRVIVKNYSTYMENNILLTPIRENHEKEIRSLCNSYIKAHGTEFCTIVEKAYEKELKRFSQFANNPLEV